MKHLITGTDMTDLGKSLSEAHDASQYDSFVTLNKEMSRKDIAAAIAVDRILVSFLRHFDDMHTNNVHLMTRLREHLGYVLPEILKLPDEEILVLLTKSRKDILEQLKVKVTMGADLGGQVHQTIQQLAQNLETLHEQKETLREAIHYHAQKIMPNASAVLGPELAARLLSYAGNLKKLALMPSSTIQLLGAHKALFRHLSTGSKTPKHGILFTHPFVKRASREKKGNHARFLADKVSLALKVDYFKGEYIADGLIEQLEKHQ
jgi:nucleolar protein 56